MKLCLSELHYNLGHILHQQGDLVGAVAAYQQAIQLAPEFAQAHHSWAVVLGEQGDYAAAIDRFRTVIALQPDAVKAYNNIGCILIQQGKLDQARQLYQEAIAIKSDWAVLHNHLGKAIEAQDPVGAIAAYRRALQLQPDLVSAHYNLGQALHLQRQHEAAIACFEDLLELDPAHIAAHTACGLAYSALSQWDQALDHFRQAILPQQAWIRAFCAWVDQLTGNDALTLARQACSQFLQSLLAVETVFPNQKAASAHSSGSFVGTVLDRNRPEDIRQYLAQAYLQFGNVLMQYGGSNQYQQAESYYQKALQLQPDHLDLYLKLVECLGQQKRWNAAYLINRFALTLFPNAASLHQSLGYALERQGRWMEAIAYYRQALKLAEHRHSIELSGELSIARSCNAAPSVVSGSQPVNSLLQASKIQGFYPSTLDWIADKPFCRAVTFNPGIDHIAVSRSVEYRGCRGHAPCVGVPPPHPVPHTSENRYSWRCATNISPIPSSPANPISANRTGPSVPIAVCNSTASGSDLNSDSEDHSSCGGLNCHRCLQKIVRQFSPIHLGKGVYTCQAQVSDPEPLSYFVAQIPQAQAWMTPYQTPWMVANSIAILTPDQYVLADVSREYPGQLPGCNLSHSKFERVLQYQDSSAAEQIPGLVAVLAGLSGHNYFHWMVDVLPRFELLRRGGIDLTNIDWFWINDPQSSFQRETLRVLDIPAEKILASDRHPHIQADQLIVPSFPGYLGWLEPWALAFLRQQFLPIADPQVPRYERIYISRSKAHHRRLLNESAVLDRLKAHNFVCIELESLTLAEQVALFAHAKMIVAPHGGGLTNLLFCSPDTTVIEFFAPNYIRHYYWVISQQLGLRHYFVQGETLNCMPIQQLMYPSSLMEDIWIDLQALNTVLSRLGLQ